MCFRKALRHDANSHCHRSDDNEVQVRTSAGGALPSGRGSLQRYTGAEERRLRSICRSMKNTDSIHRLVFKSP